MVTLEQFSSEQTRAVVSNSAWRVFLQDAAWLGFTSETRCSVLGDVSEPLYESWMKSADVYFTRDQLDRIVLVHAIRERLEKLFGCANASAEWLVAAHPKKDAVFGGRTPLEHVVQEGMIGLYHILTRLEKMMDDITTALAGWDEEDDSDDLHWTREKDSATRPRLLH